MLLPYYDWLCNNGSLSAIAQLITAECRQTHYCKGNDTTGTMLQPARS